MTLSEILVAELQHEAISLRKSIERVPASKFDWKPHQKSMSLKTLTVHCAEIFGMIDIVLNTDELDFATAPAKSDFKTTEEIVAFFEKGFQASIDSLLRTPVSDFEKQWTMRNGEHIILQLPKAAVIRSMGMNHLYHHRGQLSVYLRLLDIPVPSLYGPSADEQ